MSLPVRLGGLGINNPVSDAKDLYSNSAAITKPLVDIIVTQDGTECVIQEVVRSAKAEILMWKAQRLEVKAKDNYQTLSHSQQYLVDLAKEKGSSSWLSVLPIAHHGFSLHKGPSKML